MNNLFKSLLVFCVLVITTNRSVSEEDVVQSETSRTALGPAKVNITDVKSTKEPADEGRNLAADFTESNDLLKKNSKPLRSIFLGIYKNYKSTYLGNKTLTEYKQTLRENMKNKQQQQQQEQTWNTDLEDDENEGDGIVTEYPENDEEENMATTTVTPQPEPTTTTKPSTTATAQPSPAKPEAKSKLSPNRKRKFNVTSAKNNLQKYSVGPALNLSLDVNNGIVKVNLDGESLTELVTGRWLNDNTEEGRGKKYEMVTRILPLFILPFLIQSAIVPFLVTKLKLLLMKSILVGKLAIFLIVISAIRNSNKQMQTYEVSPSYWAGEPSRRSELAAAASNMAYNGYRVEGKPAVWIN